jgi:hypothetical protein
LWAHFRAEYATSFVRVVDCENITEAASLAIVVALAIEEKRKISVEGYG